MVEKEKRDIVQGMIDDGKSKIEVYHAVRETANHYLAGLREKGLVSHSQPQEGFVPTIHVTGQTLAEVWENALISIVAVGQDVHTGYDTQDKKGEYISFPSAEATVMMNIADVFGEPRFHKNYLTPLGMSLGDYTAEMEGIKDHWMVATPDRVIRALKEGNFDLPESGEPVSEGKREPLSESDEWKYTYHQRLVGYPYLDIEAQPRTINQISCLLDKLQREPLSKSAQAITWDPRFDHNDGQMIYTKRTKAISLLVGEDEEIVEPGVPVRFKNYDSPCLQRLWFRLVPNKDGSYTLNLNTHWRSRDHAKAVPQNIYAVTETYFRQVRKSLEERLDMPVKFGRYVDINDSLHVYGHYLDYERSGADAKQLLKVIFDAASGQPAEERFLTPGEVLHEVTTDWIGQEYKFRKEHPEKTDILPKPS